MNSAERQTVLHCLKSMIDEAVCEECPLYGTTGTDHCEEDCVRLAINALEQEPCEDEYIKVPKKALKYRTAGMVAYNAEWLKNHFDIERAVICGEQESCDDAISRKAVLEIIRKCHCEEWIKADIGAPIEALPPVKPQYTDAEIQKMQDLEFAEIQKAYELGKADGSIGADVLDKIRAEIIDTLYVDSLIFGELMEFKEEKIGADDVIEEFNRVTRAEVLQIIDKYKAESEVQDASCD